MEVYFATEGNDDEAIARRLLAHAGLKAGRSPGAVSGKAVLDGKLPTYARTAKTIPWLILRDLDHDAPCPGRLIENLIPDCPPLLVLRVAVRAIESCCSPMTRASLNTWGCLMPRCRVSPSNSTRRRSRWSTLRDFRGYLRYVAIWCLKKAEGALRERPTRRVS